MSTRKHHWMADFDTKVRNPIGFQNRQEEVKPTLTIKQKMEEYIRKMERENG